MLSRAWTFVAGCIAVGVAAGWLAGREVRAEAGAALSTPGAPAGQVAPSAGPVDHATPEVPVAEPSRLAAALPGAKIYAPRPTEEWQGMRIRPEDHWPCQEGGFCSLARACVEGRCVACTEDAQCGSGERCVLEHCVREQNAECAHAADCGEPEAKCVLSGITAGDPRGNADMKATCLSPWGGESEADSAAAN